MNAHLLSSASVSPRPRTRADTHIIDATARVISRLGPNRFTLADVAGESGLAPATLLQRFGSKQGLLRAFASQAAGRATDAFAVARQAGASPLQTLLEVLPGVVSHLSTPAELANNLAFLQLDLSDPQFFQYAAAFHQTLRLEISSLLQSALAAGELAAEVDVARLARAVHVAYNGSLLVWALEQRGALADQLRDDLSFVLSPYVRPPQTVV